MKTLIIRKPKFMRSDYCMKIYLDVAETIGKEACKPELSPGQRYYLLKKVGECLYKAAKAGGFFRTKDFLAWVDKNKNTH